MRVNVCNIHHQIYNCECGFALRSCWNESSQQWLQCDYELCTHHGVRWEVPHVELHPIECEAGQDRGAPKKLATEGS